MKILSNHMRKIIKEDINAIVESHDNAIDMTIQYAKIVFKENDAKEIIRDLELSKTLVHAMKGKLKANL